MNRTRSMALCSTVFLAVLAVLLLPGAASAAPAYNAIVVDSPVQPTFSIPGLFSLIFGESGSTTQLEIPGLNATATVDGLTLGPTLGWNAITLSQKEPAVGEAGTISGAQVNIGGPESGYSGTASAQIDLHPGPGFKAQGTVGVVYDGMSKSTGVMLQDASVMVPTWPVGFAATGINTGQGALSVDTALVGLPAVGTAMTVNGLRAGSGGTTWDSLSFAQGPDAALKIGDVATISGVELNVPGAGSEQPATLSADFTFNVGEVAQLEGTVIGVKDQTGGSSGIALQDTYASVQIPGWDLQLAGINSVQGGMKVENISLVAEPIHLTAELTGVTVGAGGGMAFDQAQITYLPTQDGKPAPGAFQITMVPSDAGYILTTTSLLPIAAR